MGLIYKYVREGQLYSRDQLRDLFEFTKHNEISENDEYNAFLKILKRYRVLKTIKGKKSNAEDESLLDDDDEDYIGELPENAGLQFLFRYVGMLSCKNRVIYIYPKYVTSTSTDDLQLAMHQVIRVLQKYKSVKKEIIDEYTDNEGTYSFNFLSLIAFLINDYLSHGLYSNDESIIEVNGQGDTLWQKTTDELYPIIKENKVYYPEVYTYKNISNENDYICKLHAWILTSCSKQLKESGLSDIFGYPVINVSESEKHEFGDNDYILSQIDSEECLQFDDRKIMLLSALRAYIRMQDDMGTGDNAMLLIGTRSFHTVWEAVCSAVFSSQRDERLQNIGKTITKIHDYLLVNHTFNSLHLLELIKKPLWDYKGIIREPQDTFIPDALCFFEEAGVCSFYILDAKYYCPVVDGSSIRKNPGVEDVAKQYLYYLAYKYFLDKISIRYKEVNNYFLMPKESGDIENVGNVKLDFWDDFDVPKTIGIILLPADMIYNHYIKGLCLPLNRLDI